MSSVFEFSSNPQTDYERTEGDFFSPHPSPPSTVSSSNGSSGTYKTADGGPSSQHHPCYPTSSFSTSLIPHLMEVSERFQEFTNLFQGPVRDNQHVDRPFQAQNLNVDLSTLPGLPRHLVQAQDPISAPGNYNGPILDTFTAASSYGLGLNTLDFPASHLPAPQGDTRAPQSPQSQDPCRAPVDLPVNPPLTLVPPPLPVSSANNPIPTYRARHDQDLFLPEIDPVSDDELDPEDLLAKPSQFVEDPGNEGDNEGDRESLPAFSARFRRHTDMPTYTGNALVSLDDIRIDKVTQRNRMNVGIRTTTTRAAGLARRRPPHKLRLSSVVRKEIASLTRMTKGVTLVGVCQALSNNELNAFAILWKANAFHHLHSDCCDIENFFIDLVNTPRSPWNQSASRVFAVYFVKQYKLSQSPDMLNVVREAFFTRIKTMRADLKRLNSGRDAIELSRQSTRRWLRKQTLFNNRLAISEHPLLQRYRPIVLQLGVAGMSTDESDQETTNQGQTVIKTFRILIPIWRISGLTPPLRFMDKMYLFIRKMTGTLKGALPRIRIAPDIETEIAIRAQAHNPVIAARARFVNNLPKCAYDIVWFGICASDGFRFDLKYTNEEHDFTITLELLAYFEKYLGGNAVNLHPGTLHPRLAFGLAR